MKAIYMKFFFLASIIGTSVHTTYADDAVALCQDQITLQLQEEGWVTSKTALVTVGIQAATAKKDSSQLIQQITEKLKHVISDTSAWKIVALSTEKNSAGLISVAATMSARLTHDQLTQLQGAIDQLNTAGEQFTVQNIDYQPQAAEIAEEKTHLRQSIYRDALEQQTVMNNIFSGATYRVQTLSFNEPYMGMHTPQVVMLGAVGGARSATESEQATTYSQQVTLTANVTFSNLDATCLKAQKK